MKPKEVMLIAGEASGDSRAAELVRALRDEIAAAENRFTSDSQPLRTALEPRFFGAGGPRMQAAGVELAVDMTQYSVIGFFDVARKYFKFRRLFHRLLKLAIERQPDVIVGVDFGGFNLRFAHAVRRYVNAHQGWFHGWRPKIVQYVSPQVWASRAGRVFRMARDHDLVLSIFPFEKEWYAERVPKLRVEFVGHPLAEQYRDSSPSAKKSSGSPGPHHVLLLPGSRKSELYRHLPILLPAAQQISARVPVSWRIVLPNDALTYILAKCLLRQFSKSGTHVPVTAYRGAEGLDAVRALANKFLPGLEVQIGHLPEALAQADLAIASSGTVTVECASFGVPAVTLYKASWRDYLLAKQFVTVKWLTMPNLLANDEVYPEFIQSAATTENITRTALELLQSESRRAQVKARLAAVVATLGGPGANRRAAKAIARLLTTNEHE